MFPVPSLASFDETIDRGSGPTPLILLLHVSFELCRSWQLLLLHVSLSTVVHLEHSSWASYNHRRALPLTRRTLEGCWGAWPAWWEVNKLSICCKSARKCIGGRWGEGHQIESYITLPVAPLWCDLGFFPSSRGNKAAVNPRPNMLCSTFKRLWYVLHWFYKLLYNMPYNMLHNTFNMLYTTFVT